MTKTLLSAFLLALAASATALAQDTPAGFDSRWTPYLGCWTVAQDQMGQQPITVPDGTLVCVTPSGRAGVTMTTSVNGKNVLEQTVVADGSPQPLSQADCRGTQANDWSRDGERLFTRVSLECSGRPARTITGITMLAKGHWVDVQATVADGDHDLRVRRYRRTSDRYTGAAGFSGSPLNVEDVIEASAKVQAPALEVALDELGGRFTLTSRVLRQLADGGVSPNVIDLMVAQAYPERFQVDRGIYPPSPYPSARAAGTSTTVVMGSSAYPYPLYDPFYSGYYYYSPFAYPYYWGSSYRYRFGYPYYPGYYNFNYYGYPGGVYYPPVVSGPGSQPQPGSPGSRGGSGIATSRGYTRVRPSGSTESGESAAPASRRGNAGRGRTVDSGSSSGSSGSSGSSNSSGSSGSGGASSGSGGGGGRTAQPR